MHWLRKRSVLGTLTLLVTLVGASACGEGERTTSGDAPSARGLGKMLRETGGIVLTAEETARLGPSASGSAPAPATGLESGRASAVGAVAALRASTGAGLGPLTVDYPEDESIFPPDLVGPTLLWHDDTPSADAWLIDVAFADGSHIVALVPDRPPPKGEIDTEALGPTNSVYELTEYQASARSWTPDGTVWDEVQRRSREQMATLTFTGFSTDRPTRPLSRGRVRLMTSKDPVGAPIFYRDVPLMPSVGSKGVIQPLGRGALPLIRWRLRDLSKPESRVVLTGMPTCANCHSFSRDGKTMGMDVDGPDGDKGAYLLSPVSQNMVIEKDDVISWNSFKEKPKGHKTIGFLSRVSPDGRYALTTLNEELYVSNFTDFRFLQVFYPTRGILAWYSRETGEMNALPGTDDIEYVHTNGVWSPDGKTIVFSRARAIDVEAAMKDPARYPNDPKEPRIQYDLYRVPFNEGRGGTPVPIEGASANGMSNTFPKISPDGKWIVLTKCENGQLMRPDGRLWIVPFEGGEAREMRCNTAKMNSWHTFSPNARWMAFSSKVNTPYTQMFLTHIDEDGTDSPPILVPNSTAANRAVNIPEFLNAQYEDLQDIRIPAVNHHRFLQRAIDKLKENKPAEAIVLFQKALELDPELSRAWGGLAYAFAELGEDGPALEAYKNALSMYEKDALSHLGLGSILYKQGRVHEGLTHLRRAVDLSPGLLAARTNLGLALLERGREDEALPHLLQALLLDNKNVGIHRSIAALYLDRGSWEEGLAHLRDVIYLDEGDVRYRTLLAWHLATCPDGKFRNGEEARLHAEKACEMSRWARPEPMDALAAALAESGDFPEAVRVARRARAAAREKNPALVPEVDRRIRLYEAGRPFRGR